MQGADWDYVVVGAGTTGCVVASRLAERPDCRVLLLDAGRDDRHLYTRVPAGQMRAFPRLDMNWLYQSEGDPSRGGRTDIWPAGKIVGGGSAINGMMFVRGHASDYDHWSSLGNDGWSYSEVLPYFVKSESSEIGEAPFRGKSGPQHVSRVRIDSPLTDAFIKAATQVGIPFNSDLNGERQEGVGHCQASQRKGWRYSTAAAYLRGRSRANLSVRLGVTVERLIIEQGRARGAQFSDTNGSETALASRGVVVCAGAIATPKLLMLSGIGDPEQLAEFAIPVVHPLRGVGKNLQDHPVVRMSFHVRGARTLTSDLNNPLRSALHGLNYLFRGRGALATCIGHAQALVHTRPSFAAPNAQIIFAPLSYDLTPQGPKPYRRPAVGVGIGLCRTQSRGEIRLQSAHSSDPPRISLNLLEHQDDVDQLREAMELTRKIFAAPAFAGFFEDERLPGADLSDVAGMEHYIRATSGLMYHACGTCRMGTDALAVVDSRLRVLGLDGLWVADASVFPTVPAGNINATCIMIGEKAADMIPVDSEAP